MSYKVLIVDDDKDIVSLISDILEDEGYIVSKCYNGREAVDEIKNNNYDLILLDIMLPDMDGYDICKAVRDYTSSPIIFLTAKNRNFDKVIGFEFGGDDYISKPFDDNELLARIKAHLKRQERVKNSLLKDSDSEILKFRDVTINQNSFEVMKKGKKVDLSTREFQILVFLAKNSNKILSREEIYHGVWGSEEGGELNTVTVHIKKLRQKLDKEENLIKTIWGVGYKFVGDK